MNQEAVSLTETSDLEARLEAENASEILEIGVIHPFRVIPPGDNHQNPQPGTSTPSTSRAEPTATTSGEIDLGPIPSRSRADFYGDTVTSTRYGIATTSTASTSSAPDGVTLQISDVRHDPSAWQTGSSNGGHTNEIVASYDLNNDLVSVEVISVSSDIQLEN